MTGTVTIVTGDYPHTRRLKTLRSFAGADAEFISVEPVHDAFDDMINHQKYDVCEMALGAFLQARDAGKPLLLLPAVLVGSHQHRNLYASPAGSVTTPHDLTGGKIGLRSYSQTTPLWVKGWLAEEFGLSHDQVTWVVTERSHSDAYVDPANVVLTGQKLPAVLLAGDIDAAILGRNSAPAGVEPLVADYAERDRAWYQRHGFAPINHMVAVTEALVTDHPEVVRNIYSALAEGIDSRESPAPGALPSPIRHGFDQVRGAVALAAEYALTQGLISRPVGDVDALFAFSGKMAASA
jgi:4,5-dihydroxyphthalate decarboxylase